MFFTLSKIAWLVFNPASLFLLLVFAAAVLAWTRWQRAARLAVTSAAALGFLTTMVSLGGPLTALLENRFPIPERLPERIDGIIVLGGVVNQFVSRARGQVAIGGAVERLTEAALLARRHPEAKLVYTGGSGEVFRQDFKETDVLTPVLDLLGLDPARVILENRSRNTAENATLTRDLVRPEPGETWVLVTSAAHMPRAVGCFRQAGWTVVPYPVDFGLEGTEKPGLRFDLDNPGALVSALHEWAGLAVYRLTGRTDAFFPAPEPR